jgi:hypothetical protein
MANSLLLDGAMKIRISNPNNGKLQPIQQTRQEANILSLVFLLDICSVLASGKDASLSRKKENEAAVGLARLRTPIDERQQ